MEKYKLQLEAEKLLLEEELSGLGRKNENTGEWEAVSDDAGATESDESDMDDRSEDYEEKSSLINVLVKKLNTTIKALLKIEEGTYGVCDTCGGKLEDDRIEANPSALTCKNCM